MKRLDQTFRSISNAILQLVREEAQRSVFLDEVSHLLLSQTGCDAVDILLREGGRNRRCSAAKHQPLPSAPSRGNGELTLDDLCHDLLDGALLRSGRRFTPAGSFWTGAADKRVRLQRGRSRGESCYSLGWYFKSIALVPFDLDEGQGGILVLKSSRPRFFSRRTVELCESIAQLLGVTIGHRRILLAHRSAEQARLQLQEQLRHADRLATIGQLSAGVAHELNEPLGSILGFAQLALKAPQLPEQVQRDLDKIITASLHAREVISKLMLYARQTPPQKNWVDLNVLVRDGLYFLESRCAKSGISLIRELEPTLPEITADPGQLYQVLVNLSVNAIQAMEDGGTLTIRTADSEQFVSLEVEDTGIGLSEEVREQIFLPFFTTKDVGEGTGLGLAVAEGIVTSHGGTIAVQGKPGAGTTFTVMLPKTGAVERPLHDQEGRPSRGQEQS